MTKKEQSYVSTLNKMPLNLFNKLNKYKEKLGDSVKNISISMDTRNSNGYTIEIEALIDTTTYKTSQFIGLSKTVISSEVVKKLEITNEEKEIFDKIKSHFKSQMVAKLPHMIHMIRNGVSGALIRKELNTSKESILNVQRYMDELVTIKEEVVETETPYEPSISPEVESNIVQDLIADKDYMEIAVTYQISTNEIKDIEKRFKTFIKERKKIHAKSKLTINEKLNGDSKKKKK